MMFKRISESEDSKAQLRADLKAVIEWGEKPCPHFPADYLTYECWRCWKELKIQLEEME
jgi:hypothetical protein